MNLVIIFCIIFPLLYSFFICYFLHFPFIFLYLFKIFASFVLHNYNLVRHTHTQKKIKTQKNKSSFNQIYFYNGLQTSRTIFRLDITFISQKGNKNLEWGENRNGSLLLLWQTIIAQRYYSQKALRFLQLSYQNIHIRTGNLSWSAKTIQMSPYQSRSSYTNTNSDRIAIVQFSHRLPDHHDKQPYMNSGAPFIYIH